MKGKERTAAKGKASAKAKGKSKAGEESVGVDREEESTPSKKKWTGWSEVMEDEDKEEDE